MVNHKPVVRAESGQPKSWETYPLVLQEIGLSLAANRVNKPGLLFFAGS